MFTKVEVALLILMFLEVMIIPFFGYLWETTFNIAYLIVVILGLSLTLLTSVFTVMVVYGKNRN